MTAKTQKPSGTAYLDREDYFLTSGVDFERYFFLTTWLAHSLGNLCAVVVFSPRRGAVQVDFERYWFPTTWLAHNLGGLFAVVVFLSQGLELAQSGWIMRGAVGGEGSPVGSSVWGLVTSGRLGGLHACLDFHGSRDLASGQRRRNYSNLLTSLLPQSLNLCSSVIWLARQLDLTSWSVITI